MIEAVFEQIPVKEEIFKKLDAGHEARARFCYSNTSGIDIDIMANVTNRPQDVAGTHFFAPANVMKLFEVVQGTQERARRASRPRWRSAARSARSARWPAIPTASSRTAAARRSAWK